MIFTAASYQAGQDRVENGTLGTVLVTACKNRLEIRTQEPQPREVAVNTKEFADLRLAYAQHVYKAQGRTVERAFVLTGGWQTDRERAYVSLTRARERTDIYVAREDLGQQGIDAGAIERLGHAIAQSHAQEASVARAEQPRPEHSRERTSAVAQAMRESEQERERELRLGGGIEP